MSLPIKVLIVDDNKRYLCMLKTVLEFADLKVRIAESAKQALDAITKETPDIILTDLMMPGMDGIELAMVVKDIAPGVPMFMLTAAKTGEVEALAFSTGIVKVLDKCISPTDIGRLVKEEVRKLKTLPLEAEKLKQIEPEAYKIDEADGLC